MLLVRRLQVLHFGRMCIRGVPEVLLEVRYTLLDARQVLRPHGFVLLEVILGAHLPAEAVEPFACLCMLVVHLPANVVQAVAHHIQQLLLRIGDVLLPLGECRIEGLAVLVDVRLAPLLGLRHRGTQGPQLLLGVLEFRLGVLLKRHGALGLTLRLTARLLDAALRAGEARQSRVAIERLQLPLQAPEAALGLGGGGLEGAGVGLQAFQPLGEPALPGVDLLEPGLRRSERRLEAAHGLLVLQRH
mmetsp:Transcript_79177/g.242245  ORF Transcript_79177/g.242245 Transcript_79177/m.242245 type:complete len:245 (-) Transcript_79177:774-1508(-)